MCQAGGEENVLLAARFFHPGRRPDVGVPGRGLARCRPLPAVAKTACDWVACLICERARGGMGCPVAPVSWQNAAERGRGHQTCHPIARGFWREGPRAERGEGQTPNRARFVAAPASGSLRPAAAPASSRPALRRLRRRRARLAVGYSRPARPCWKARSSE